MPPKSRGATFPPPNSRGLILSLSGGERIRGVPVASQEEALSRGKARGTPASCHHCQSPPDVSVHSREPGFPALPRLSSRVSTHTTVARRAALWESLVGKPRGKSTDPLIHAKGSVTLLLQLGRKAHVHAPTRDEDLRLWGDYRSPGRSMSALERNPQVPALTPHKVLGPGIDRRGIPRGPRATRMGTGLS